MRIQISRLTGRRGDRGGSAVEYALVLTLIALAIVLGATAFGAAVGQMFDVTL